MLSFEPHFIKEQEECFILTMSMKKVTFKKISAVCLAFLTLIQPLYAEGLTGMPSASAGPDSWSAPRLRIPAETGLLENSISGTGPEIFHVQTAHGHFLAQKNIQKILNLIQADGGIDLLLLEGSEGRLDAGKLRFFPERMDLTVKTLDELARQSVAKGPDLFLAEHAGTAAYGMESLDSYLQNAQDIRALVKGRRESGEWIRRFEAQLTALIAQDLNSHLRKYLRGREDYRAGQRPAEVWIDELVQLAGDTSGLDLNAVQSQMEWPMLARVLALKKLARTGDLEKQKAEIAEFVKTVAVRSEPLAARLNEILTKGAAQQELSPEAYLWIEALAGVLPAGFDDSKFPAVAALLGRILLEHEIGARGLGAELEKLQALVAERLAVTEKERRILTVINDFYLVKKLFLMELVPADHLQLLQRGESMHPDKLETRLSSASSSQGAPSSRAVQPDSLDVTFEAAMRFYQGTQARDRDMLRNAERLIAETKAKRIVIVSGGFHASPFQTFFAAKHYRYVQVLPKLIVDQSSKDSYFRTLGFFGEFGPREIRRSTFETPDFLGLPDAALERHHISARAVFEVKHSAALQTLRLAGLPDGRVQRYLSLLGPQARAGAAVVPGAGEKKRSEMRNVPAPLVLRTDLIAYAAENKETRALQNQAALFLKESVSQGLEETIRAVHELKKILRDAGRLTGVVNRMLFEVTRDDADLRGKISEYYRLLQERDEAAREGTAAHDALGAMRFLGVGDLMTVSPEAKHAKAGGMADVVTELYPELARAGASVSIVSFLYRDAQTGAPGENGKNLSAQQMLDRNMIQHEDAPLGVQIGPRRFADSHHDLPDSARNISVEVYRHRDLGIDLEEIYLYAPQHTSVLYPGHLSGATSLELAILLSRGALEYARGYDRYPDFIFTNDWMASLIPLYLRTNAFDTSYSNDTHLRNAQAIAVGHNLGKAYQMNIFTTQDGVDIFPMLNIGGEHFFGISDPRDHSRMNLVQAAFYHAHRGLMVSPGYLLENLQPGSISGLELLLQDRIENLGGISNGLDSALWRRNYDAIGRAAAGLSAYEPISGASFEDQYLHNLPAYKAALKFELQTRYAGPAAVLDGGKPEYYGRLEAGAPRPLFALVARLAEQKGIELLTEGLRRMLDETDAQILIAGSVPDTDPGSPEDVFKRAMMGLAGEPRYAGRLAFHPAFVKPDKIFMGADGFLMPSKQEPGGIAQLQALLAGATVVGRATGGIANTVTPFNEQDKTGDGFVFNDFSSDAFHQAFTAAVSALGDEENRLAIIQNAASTDNSWAVRVPLFAAFLQNAAGVLAYDYPHLAGTREKLKTVQPQLNRSEMRAALPNESVRWTAAYAIRSYWTNTTAALKRFADQPREVIDGQIGELINSLYYGRDKEVGDIRKRGAFYLPNAEQRKAMVEKVLTELIPKSVNVGSPDATKFSKRLSILRELLAAYLEIPGSPTAENSYVRPDLKDYLNEAIRLDDNGNYVGFHWATDIHKAAETHDEMKQSIVLLPGAIDVPDAIETRERPREVVDEVAKVEHTLLISRRSEMRQARRSDAIWASAGPRSEIPQAPAITPAVSEAAVAETGQAPNLALIAGTVRPLFVLRQRLLPIRLYDVLNPSQLTALLSLLLGHEAVQVAAAPASSVLQQAFGLERLQATQELELQLTQALESQGRLMIGAEWIRTLLAKNPRALFILLNALEQVRAKNKAREPLIYVPADRILLNEIRDGLLRQNVRAGKSAQYNRAAGLSALEKMRADAFTRPDVLEKLLGIVEPAQTAELAEKLQYGIVSLLGHSDSSARLDANPNFIVGLEGLSDFDLTGLVLLLPRLLQAAARIRAIEDASIRYTRLLESVPDLGLFANPSGRDFKVNLTALISRDLTRQALIETAA